MTAKELREKFIKFFEDRGHIRIPSASLIPEKDESVKQETLFITAGMQPLIPYLLGKKHPAGDKLVDVQKCIRTKDIDEVGDNRHLTFFEMLGNWSLGSYFKEDAIKWSFEFLTDKEKGLGLDPKRLYVTVFKGEGEIPRDEKSIEIWQEVFDKAGIKAEVAGEDEIIKDDVRIIPLGKDDNFWIAGDTGPCGGDTEMFYDVSKKGDKLSGKFSDLVDTFRIMEVWNDVFIEFNKTEDGKYQKLEKPNVDTGMGLERTLKVVNSFDNIFQTDVLEPIIKQIEELSGKKYSEYQKEMRVIADHIKAAVFIIGDGVDPSNKDRGYVVRRLIRRAVRYGKIIGIEHNFISEVASVVIGIYKDVYPEICNNRERIFMELKKEENKFRETLELGVREVERVTHYIESIKLVVKKLEDVLKFIIKNPFKKNLSLIDLKEDFIKQYLDYEPFKKIFSYYNENLKKYLNPVKPLNEKEFGEIRESLNESEFIFDELDNALKNIKLNGVYVFYLYQTFSIPFELIKEIANEKGLMVDEKEFEEEFKKHQELSRTASAGQFKGGLADAGIETTRLHTAAHLMLAALRQVLGEHVVQRGSNITAERLRFDFSHPQKVTPEEIKKVEELVNEQIAKKIPVVMSEMTVEEAKTEGATGVFEHKYGDKVKVYAIGDFSKEICGGPHVDNTGELGQFKIIKEEASSAGIRRIKAVLEQ